MYYVFSKIECKGSKFLRVNKEKCKKHKKVWMFAFYLLIFSLQAAA